MAEVADQFFTKSWIDAPVRPGKQPGAFAHPTVPSAHPYVLLNYMVASMRPGSVIVDLAVERGGNVEGARGGEVAQVGGVKIVGYLNVPGRLAASASSLYAKNLLTFVETLIDKKEKKLAINWDDELIKATLLTRDGAVVHPNFQPKTAA